MNKEAKFLGGLLQSHPDYEPIIAAARLKYGLREVYPQDETIEEIYLGDEVISDDEFTQDIRNQVLENMETMFPEDYVKKYRSSKNAIEADYQKDLEKFSDELKPVMETFFEYIKSSAQTVYQLLDAQIDALTNILCRNLLLGDAIAAPEDWFGKVMTMNTGGETVIVAMASEVTNLEFMYQQIQNLHKKTFGSRRVKITQKTVDTAYFLQLTRRNKDRDFVLDEFIRLNKFDLPKNRNSPRYAEVRNKYWQRLRKRLKKAEDIINAIGQGKK